MSVRIDVDKDAFALQPPAVQQDILKSLDALNLLLAEITAGSTFQEALATLFIKHSSDDEFAACAGAAGRRRWRSGG